jgi:hypothetical protein
MTKYTERIIWPLVGTQDGLSVLAADLRMRGGRMGAVGAVTPVWRRNWNEEEPAEQNRNIKDNEINLLKMRQKYEYLRTTLRNQIWKHEDMKGRWNSENSWIPFCPLSFLLPFDTYESKH